ncbi:MAG: MbnP family protein [Crocinitomicaceae bacterium]
MKFLILNIILLTGLFSRSQELKIEFKAEATALEVTKFRFYISNIVVNDSVVPPQEHAYLVEPLKNEILRIPISKDHDVESIKFLVGTDSTLNTAGILEGDLDPIKGMYWAWNTGYINLKLEGKKDEEHFEYHIGGYRSPFATVREFHTEINTNKLTFRIDLDAFLKEANQLGTSIMIPGENAFRLADEFIKAIHLD